MTSDPRTHLELPVTGEDADPLVVVVGDDDVAAGVDGHARGTLQLSRRPTTNPEAALELSLVGEDLQQDGTRLRTWIRTIA